MAPRSRPIRNLEAPEYSRLEQIKILDYFRDLKADLIRNFLSDRNLRRSGNKSQLLIQISENIDAGQLQYKDLVNFLDTLIPWGKQHVFLYNGPEQEVIQWRLVEHSRQILEQNGNLHILNAKLPLILPQSLTLSSIEHVPNRSFKILAVEGRNNWERCQEHDDSFDDDGVHVERHAYRNQVLRGIMIFNWNLVSNQARLQISQLPSNGSYERAERTFQSLVQPWFPFNLFQKLDLRRPITRLTELEDLGTPEARSHGFSLKTPGGRNITAASPTSHDSVHGEPNLDRALRTLRPNSIGHLGNFYWLPTPQNNLNDEIHTIIVGNKGRINFPTPNPQEDFEFVLSRVRTLCN